MRFIDEFRSKDRVKILLREIEEVKTNDIRLMEVCGTHTQAIFRFGLRRALPKGLNLLSGPGCPVCVTSSSDIEMALEIAKLPSVILTTFGDMMKVPAGERSLEKERANNRDIRVVYSIRDALKIASYNKDKDVVFFGVGFETTAPATASVIIEAEEKKIKNFFLLSSHKLIPPAMGALLSLGEVSIDGFICPGHVSTIIGSLPYDFIPKKYNIPCVIAGFEPLDILLSILMLIRQNNNKEAKVEIEYKRSVRPEGNLEAKRLLSSVFKTEDAEWRGFGVIPQSGLKLKEDFSHLDAEKRFDISLKKIETPPTSCICAHILRGIKTPYDCPLFSKECTPDHPVGPCMVSYEGACSAYLRYGVCV